MRILNLKMQAFGAYPGFVEIPFDKFQGLYLINGVTGSGKTTIFDAVSFALFNDSSGSIKGNTFFKSHYAKDETPCFVELTFLFNQKEYKIKRTPFYKRKKIKGEGLIDVKPTAELYLPDGKIITGVKEVDSKVVEILGVNSSQFSQIALLAQGEFLKLLNCDTEKRGEIFRKIFKTQDFINFSLKLKDKSTEYKNKYETCLNSILQYVLQLSTTNEAALKSQKEYLEFKVLNSFNEFILNLKKENLEDEKSESDLDLKIKKTEKEYLNIHKTLENIKNIKDLKNQKLAFENRHKLLIPVFEEVKKEFFNLEFDKKEYESLNQKANLLLKDVEKSKELQKEEGLLLAKTKEKENYQKNILNFESKIFENKNNHLKNLYLKILKLNENLKKSQDEFNLFQQNLDVEKFDLINLENKYFSSQAGILAKNLKENEPCPVCGSKIHPNPAKNFDFEITKESLNIKKETIEKKTLELQKLSLNCQKINEEVKFLNLEFEKFEKNYEIKLNKNEISKVNEFLNIDFEEKIKKDEKSLLESKNLLNALMIEISSNETKINLLKKDLDNKDTNKILKEYDGILTKSKDLKNKIDSIEKKYHDSTLEIENLNSKINLLEKQISNANKEEKEEEVLSEISKINLELSNLKLQKEEVSIKKNLNKSLINQIEHKYSEFVEIEQNYKQFKILSEVANGNLKNKAKISFEQYIQSYYLDLVLNEANKRLKIMTKNQFKFLRKQKITSLQSKTALELEVMDFHTFKTRSVKTLSGGESFKAALSLALGLSDCVSNLSGSINIDTLFIDEGFGSLDSDSLELALDVILELSNTNRQIGIISHVEELKNRIQNQIIAIKSQDGSKLEFSNF